MRGLFSTIFSVWVFFLLLFATENIGFSKIYPWASINSQDLEITDSPVATDEIRLELMDRAQTSIDIMTFDQRTDLEVGMQIFDALERAAERGVSIRVLFSRFALFGRDPFGKIEARLQSLVNKYPGQVQYLFAGLTPGWNFTDTIHGKLLVVDRKWAMTSGSGHGFQYRSFIDTSFFFRGSFVKDCKRVYDDTWDSILKDSPYGSYTQDRTSRGGFVGESHEADQVQVHRQTWPKTSLVCDRIETNRLNKWLNEPSEEVGTPLRIRVLYHDFFNQMRQRSQFFGVSPKQFNTESRLKLLFDPVIEQVTEQLKTASQATLYSFAILFHPEISKALKQRLSDSSRFELKVFTNSAFTHRWAFFFDFGWFAGLSELSQLLGSPKVRVYTPRQSEKFLHRKMMLLENYTNDSGETQTSVHVGSHNGTVTSTVSQEEINFEISGEIFINRIQDLDHRCTQNEGVQLKVDPVLEEHRSTPWYQWISRMFWWLY